MPFYKKDNFKVFVGGCLLGLAFFLLIYGTEPVIFTNDSFVINGYIEKDLSQHYSGWMLYRNSPWEFPVGVGQNIAYPYGNAVSFTDSIPLFAIFFKLLSPLLPQTFQYFGLFVMLCFMLQGGFGALITSLFTENFASDMLGAFVFILTPVMLERAFRHCALTAHFLILACLYFYFKNKGQRDFKTYLPFIVINAMAVMIHPYFLPFTFGIMFAFCLESFFKDKKKAASAGYLFLSMAVTIAVGYVIGIFSVGGSVASIGYGFFSMNLNAFFNPSSKGFNNWSSVLSERPYMYLQIEGFNYLGLGILVFIPVSIILYIVKYKKDGLKVAFDFIKNYFGIIFSTTALFIFAVGDWVRFGGLELFRIPFPDFLVYGIFGIFRANGRFGNLFVYMIVILIIYILSSVDKKRLSIFLFTGLIAVQLFDLKLVLASKYRYFHGVDGDIQSQQVRQVLHNDFWNDAAEKYEYLYMLSDCVPNANFELTSKFAKNNKAVNTRFDIKIDEEKFQAMEKDVLRKITDGTLSDDSIVLLNFIPDKYKDAVRENGYSVFLIEDIVAVCVGDYTDEDINEYVSQGGFEVLPYPYTTQAELDFKAEYGI